MCETGVARPETESQTCNNTDGHPGLVTVVLAPDDWWRLIIAADTFALTTAPTSADTLRRVCAQVRAQIEGR